MKSEKIKIAACQTNSVDDVQENLQQMERLLLEASNSAAKIAFFPENCLYMRIREGESIPGIHLQDQSLKALSDLAKKLTIAIHLGSVPLWIGKSLFNSSIWLTPDGAIEASYQKVHLFDIALDGQTPIRESDVFMHGEKPQILSFDDWSFGQTICYDIRFSELFHFYAKSMVDALLVPSAFLVKTGQAHWEILLRARAIESQSYVIAAAQAGVHRSRSGAERETYGRSMVIDPWGNVAVEAQGGDPQVLILELERQKLETVRRQIPMKNHRRL